MMNKQGMARGRASVSILIACSIALLHASPTAARGEPIVSLELTSPANGTVIAGGATVGWIIRATVSNDNQGLAIVAVDFVQDLANPEHFDLPPSGAAPAGMEGFERPAGICNPGPGGSGYGGTPTGTPGAMNLVQIGGAQNTFGAAGGSMGQDFIVDPGIGQGSGGQLVATGTFTAPATPGSYSFLLANGVANVLTAINPPPQHSPTESASVDVTGGVMSFIVCLPGDVNGDFVVTTDDVGHFVSALLDPMGEFASCAADVNGDGNVDGKDIQHFVDALLA